MLEFLCINPVQLTWCLWWILLGVGQKTSGLRVFFCVWYSRSQSYSIENKRRHGDRAAWPWQDSRDWNPVGWRTEWEGLERRHSASGRAATSCCDCTCGTPNLLGFGSQAFHSIKSWSLLNLSWHAQGTWASWAANSAMPPWFSETRWISTPGRILITWAWRRAVDPMKRLINFCHCCLGKEKAMQLTTWYLLLELWICIDYTAWWGLLINTIYFVQGAKKISNT